MSRRIVIRASDVAACIGLNPYKPAAEVRDELWKKYFPETFTGKTRNDAAQEALNRSEHSRRVLSEALSVKAGNSAEALTNFESAKTRIEKDETIAPEDRAKILDHLKSRCFTAHGTRSEDKTASKVEAEEGATLLKDNAFYSLAVTEIDGREYVITGKIDRIEVGPDGSKTLVEIKNRARRLFRRLAEYENVQVQVYLRMLGLVHAKLIEQHNEETHTIKISRDEDIWSNIIWPRIHEFVLGLHGAAATPRPPLQEPDASGAEQAPAS